MFGLDCCQMGYGRSFSKSFWSSEFQMRIVDSSYSTFITSLQPELCEGKMVVLFTLSSQHLTQCLVQGTCPTSICCVDEWSHLHGVRQHFMHEH